MDVAPGEAAFLSTINPFQPTRVQVHYHGESSQDDPTSYEFVILCSKDNKFEEKTHDFGSLRITVGRSLTKSTRPTIWIRAENAVRVLNLSSSDLVVRMYEACENPRSFLQITAGQERSMCYPTSGKAAIFTIGLSPENQRDDSISLGEDIVWSPSILLSLMGDTKSFIVPTREKCDTSIVPAFSISLENNDGAIKLFIRPLVVVLNATVSLSSTLVSYHSRATQTHAIVVICRMHV